MAREEEVAAAGQEERAAEAGTLEPLPPREWLTTPLNSWPGRTARNSFSGGCGEYLSFSFRPDWHNLTRWPGGCAPLLLSDDLTTKHNVHAAL